MNNAASLWEILEDKAVSIAVGIVDKNLIKPRSFKRVNRSQYFPGEKTIHPLGVFPVGQAKVIRLVIEDPPGNTFNVCVNVSFYFLKNLYF